MKSKDIDFFKAISASVVLHLAILFCIAGSFSSEPEISPQQMINITLVAAPSIDSLIDKPAEQPVKKLVQKAKPLPLKTQALPSKIIATKTPAETSPEDNSTPKQLNKLSSAAGKSSATKATQQAITNPVFDAAYLNNPAPQYPANAKRRGIQGLVMLEVVVSENGRAKGVSIAESSGFAVLDSSAKDAVKKWKFIPAKLGQETVEARVIVPVDFKLE